MPPSRCLHALPIRTIDNGLLPSRGASRHLSASLTCTRSISSTHQRQASAVGPAKGTVTLRLKKKGRPEKTAKPPDVGERKALRKRIVLSNTNALTVKDVHPLSADITTRSVPEVVAVPVQHIDQLRAVEAFKPKQGWSFFQTPAVLVRENVRKLAGQMGQLGGQKEGAGGGEKTTKKMTTYRKVVVGEKSSGKSVYLLQAMTMAFQSGWVVINIPEARELSNAHTSFAPIPNTNPTLYSQPTYTANLLKQTLAANRTVLEGITVAEKPKLPFPIKDNINLAELLSLGQNDPDRAWPIFQAFWSELTTSGKQILLCLDNLAHIMLQSKYQVLNAQGKMITVHSHDLALVKHFLSYLGGQETLPNGGVVLAATSASDAPTAQAMEVGIALAETKQNIAANATSPKKAPYNTAYTRLQALSPTRSPDPTALSNFWSPFATIDMRVLSLFNTTTTPLEIVRLEGLNQQEAVELMKYWTKSGMSRGTVLPWTVQEASALSGGAVVGQLEQAVVRFLQRESVAVEGEAGGKKIRVH